MISLMAAVADISNSHERVGEAIPKYGRLDMKCQIGGMLHPCVKYGHDSYL